MYTVNTENKQFTGIRCGLAIQDGVGSTADIDQARELASLGYKVDPDPNKPAKKEPEKK